MKTSWGTSLAPACLACLLAFSIAPRSDGNAAAGGPSDLAQARSAIEDKFYDLAAAKLLGFLETAAEPREKAECALLLADALFGLQQYGKMMDVLLRFEDLLSGESWSDAYDARLALAKFGLEQWEAALECARSFESKHPESGCLPDMIRLQALSCMKLGRRDDAIALLARFENNCADSPARPLNLLELGVALAGAGRDAEAAPALERLLTLDGLPDRIEQECRIALAGVYLRLGDAAKAKGIMESMIDGQRVPEAVKTRSLDAMVNIEHTQSNLNEALALLDKEIQAVADPALKAEAKLRKGRLLLKMGRTDESIALVRGYVSSTAGAESAKAVHLELAEALLSGGHADKALTEYQNYLETFDDAPGVAAAREGKGWALFKLCRFDEAAAAFEKAGEQASDPWDRLRCMFKTADCCLAGGGFKKALALYEAVMDRCPETPLADHALFQSAEALAGMGETAEAESRLWDVVDKDEHGPLAGKALLRIARLRESGGNPGGSIAVYALVLNGSDDQLRAQALCGIGDAHYRSGSFEDALLSFEEAARASPGGEIAALSNYMRGWCLYMMGKDVDAIACFKEFVEKFPASTWAPHAAFWMAEHEFNQGAYAAAEEGFTKFINDYHSSDLADTALFWAGRAAMAQKEFRRANDHFARLIKEYPESARRAEARFYQGEALCEIGEFAGAILTFDEVIKTFPGAEIAEMAWFRKGDSHFTLGTEDSARYEEAVASYRSVLGFPNVSEQSRWQAEYKIGRCLEKLGREEEAFEYYMKVVYGYLDARARDPRSNVWFTRAAFNAAEMKEREKSWAKAVNIYQRIIDAGVPASRDAQERINKIRAEHWLFFY